MRRPWQKLDLTAVLDRVMFRQCFTVSDREILRELIRRARVDGNVTFTHPQIAESITKSVKTVQRSLSALRSGGLVILQVLGGLNEDGGRRPSTYRLSDAVIVALREAST